MQDKLNKKSNRLQMNNKIICECRDHLCHYSSSNFNLQCSMLATKKFNNPQTTRDAYYQCPYHKNQENIRSDKSKCQCNNHNIQSLSLLQSRGTSNSNPKKKSSGGNIDKCVECLSNRSCSRQKSLQNKINYMLKQQQQKIILLTNYGNRINFLHNKDFFQNQMLKNIDKDKQNSFNPNKIYNLNSKGQRLQTQKSNKLTLRNYINTTPAQTESSVNSFDNNHAISSELRSQKNTEQSRVKSQNERLTPLKNTNIKNSQVLKEVRQIKDMFLELLNKKQESKTKKKTYNFIKVQKQEQKQSNSFQQ